MPHLRRLRIHTRLPVVLPSRVTRGLVDVLASSRLARVIVIHANHPAELDAAVARALGDLAALPAILLNQAVLLAGVNDSAATLAAMSASIIGRRCEPTRGGSDDVLCDENALTARVALTGARLPTLPVCGSRSATTSISAVSNRRISVPVCATLAGRMIWPVTMISPVSFIALNALGTSVGTFETIKEWPEVGKPPVVESPGTVDSRTTSRAIAALLASSMARS
jgi:hypothetical protein